MVRGRELPGEWSRKTGEEKSGRVWGLLWGVPGGERARRIPSRKENKAISGSLPTVLVLLSPRPSQRLCRTRASPSLETMEQDPTLTAGRLRGRRAEGGLEPGGQANGAWTSERSQIWPFDLTGPWTSVTRDETVSWTRWISPDSDRAIADGVI